MLQESVNALVTDPDGIYVDGTLGSGGHSEEIGKRISVSGRLICFDRDIDAVMISGDRLKFLGNRVTIVNSNFADIGEVLPRLNIEKVQGILLDLGLSSYQLGGSGRGFSFNRDEPLDMRMDQRDSVTAGDLVNELSQKEIEKIIRVYGEERHARLISKIIGREREKKVINSSLQLANLIHSVLPSHRRPGTIDCATKTFQALRIAVNRELEHLEKFMDIVPPLIEKGGRLVFLSYHSLEDRLIKQTIKEWEKACVCPSDFPECICGKKPIFRGLFKKGIRPGKAEISDNPRARSAIMRVAERI